MKLSKVFDIIDECGWGIYKANYKDTLNDEVYVELSQGSPAGEDFSFGVWYKNAKDLVNEIKDYAECFDIDEHVEMWIDAKRNGVAGVPSISDLVEDAKEIQKMLDDLVAALDKEN